MSTMKMRHGILWCGSERIGEWIGDDAAGNVSLSQERLNQAGIKVEIGMLSNAVKDAMRLE